MDSDDDNSKVLENIYLQCSFSRVMNQLVYSKGLFLLQKDIKTMVI